ncbi:hypothetical protein [Tenacibaculum maritimum]|uniref:hypothetical protein n=1 Tax=Tenacibaculum maritimum TaxID=107401 RepID=UPI00388DB171
MKSVFKLKKGKGAYGINKTPLDSEDLLFLSKNLDPEFKEIQEYLRRNLHFHSNINVLNNITATDVNNWNTKQFSNNEALNLKTSILRNETLGFNNFFEKTSIPPFPWREGSSLVTLKNYNDGTVSGNYLLVSKTTVSGSITWDFLRNSRKVSFHFYNDTKNYHLTFSLELSTEILVDGFITFKVPALFNRAFGYFAPDNDGAYSKNTIVFSVLPDVSKLVDEYLEFKNHPSNTVN